MTLAAAIPSAGAAALAGLALAARPEAPLLWALAVVLVAAGIAGTVLPALPGAPLVFLGLLAGAAADGFTRVGWFTLTILALLALASSVLDLWATHHGARRLGASPAAMVGAAAGTLAGLFFSLPGLLLGPFLGAFAGEYLARRSLRGAGRAGLGAWLGLLIGTALKVAMVFLMIGLFALSYYL